MRIGIQVCDRIEISNKQKRNSIRNIFDNIPFMQWPFIHTLQKFQYTASSQDLNDRYIPPITTSQLFMKTCKQSSPSSGVSFAQQKSSLRTQAFTHSRSTLSTHVVENICNQIKYLIQGNLRSNNTESSMMDFVREQIIPMLIKMFFQSSKTDDSVKDSFGSPNQEFKDITNNFGVKVKSWKTQTFNGKENPQQEYCETAKSDFIRNTQLEKQQNLENQQKINENNEYQKWSESTELLNQQQTLTKTLCLSILLLKTLVVKKLFAFQQVKLFAQEKQKKVLSFVNLVKEIHVKKCLNKFYLNKLQKEKQAFVVRMAQQSLKFNQKQRKLSCQVISKIFKLKLRNHFNLFKDNCFSQNKWMRQWVRNAALRSPLTVKTSIWRLRQYFNSEQPKNGVQINVQCQNSEFQQRKVTEPDISQIRSQSEESISSNEFEKMFEDEQEDTGQGVQRISLQMMVKNNGANKNVLEDLVEQKKKYEDDEYLRTISEDEQESSTVFQ